MSFEPAVTWCRSTLDASTTRFGIGGAAVPPPEAGDVSGVLAALGVAGLGFPWGLGLRQKTGSRGAVVEVPCFGGPRQLEVFLLVSL